MSKGIRYSLMALTTVAAVALAGPASAGDDAPPMMRGGQRGMMMGGGNGPGDCGPGGGMMGGGMMGGGYNPGAGMGRMGGGMMGPGAGMGMMSGGMGMMGGGMGMGMATMHALDLDRDQVRTMAKVHQDLAQKRAGMSGDMQELRWELSQEMAKDRPDPSKVGKLYDQIAQQQKAMMEDRIRARNRMMDALNDNQREQFRQMMENMRQRRMGNGYGDMPMNQED